MNSLLNRLRSGVKQSIKRIMPEQAGSGMISALTVSDKEFLSFFNLNEVSALLLQDDIKAAKASLFNHYSRRMDPTWPSPPKTFTDLRRSLDGMDEKELIECADSFLEYNFSPDGSLPKITSEGNIAWKLSPISSPEWLWRLNRHQWWPVLGLAYKNTGDERYANAFVKQMLNWISTNPLPMEKDERSPTWRLMEAGMRMRVSWIPSFSLFFESPVFNDEAKLTMLRSIYDHGQFLSLFKTSKNHLLRESNGLAYVSVYFPEFKMSKQWQQTALTRLEQELIKQINQDGSHIEVSTGYQWVVVDEFERTYELLRSNNISLPNENLSTWLTKMYKVLVHVIRPDLTFPEINDGFIRWEYNRLAIAGALLGNDEFTCIGTEGKHGTFPEETSIGFDNAGLYIMRSDWKNEARYLLFDAGPYGGYHGHEDKLSIEVFAYGQPFIVDSGSYTYEEKDPFRTYFVGSQGHNTVLVNGHSQVRRWKKSNMNPERTSDNNVTWVSQNEFDYVAASYDEGYGDFSLRKPKEAKIISNVKHTRRILFVKPDYWILIDELQSSDLYNYQALFHSHPEIRVKAEADNRVILTTTHNSPCLFLIPADPHNINVKLVTGSENPIQGWYSTDHHFKVPSTAVIFETEKRPSTVLTTLIYPCPAGQRGDEIKIEPLDVTGGKGISCVVTTSKGTDYLILSDSHDLKKFGPYESRGMVSGFRFHDNRVTTMFEYDKH